MPYTEAIALVKALQETSVHNIVITVPNKEFNQFYELADEDTRHDDHKWEPTQEDLNAQFTLWSETSNEFKVTMKGIGDSVKGIHVSTMFTLSRKSSASQAAPAVEIPETIEEV